MKFEVTYTCANGHDQVITYGPGFEREQVGTMVALMIGGHVAPLGKDIRGSNEECGICKARVSHTVREVSDTSRPLPYPEGMGEESRRLHREYNALVAAQLAGAKNGADVVRLTDECAAKGIILVPGGEHL